MRSKNGLRVMSAPFLVALPSGARIRTRIPTSPTDEVMLTTVGEHLTRLIDQDLAVRVRQGREPDRTTRKRALTAASSSRWAGSITRTNDDQWNLSMRGLAAERNSLRTRIRVIEKRLAFPTRDRCIAFSRLLGFTTGKTPRVNKTGYAHQSERAKKVQRLQVLQARLAAVEQRLSTGHLSICRGGKRLARTRHNLEEAGLTKAEWQERWWAERLFISADGDKEKNLGNETIRWDPQTGLLELRLPSPLAHLANQPHNRYSFSAPVWFSHRAAELAAQVMTGAVRYDISFDPGKHRWYLDASWKMATVPEASVESLLSGGALGVDLNAGHLAAWVLDSGGNPVGSPETISIELAGLPESTRDGHLRAAISALIRLCISRGICVVVIEDLDFSPEKVIGREGGGRGKRFRRMIHGFPTAKFRNLLVQMCSNAGIRVVAVDPAYTSKWGAEHWHKPMQQDRKQEISGHHSAAVVIGRRGLGCGAVRRGGVTGPEQSYRFHRATPQALQNTPTHERTRHPRGVRAAPSGTQDPVSAKGSRRILRAPKTVRGVPVERDSVSLTV